MRFTLSSTALNSRLNMLSRVINSKNSLAILGCFLFQIKEGILTITASDSENIMQSRINLEKSEGEGEFAVPSHTMLDALKELPEQPLDIDINTETYAIQIFYQNGVYNFTAQGAEEYPRSATMTDAATSLTIDAGVLSDNITRSLFASAQEELRPVMNGIFFDLSPESLAIVASDGHKLVRNTNTNIHSDIPASFILSKKPAALLKNILQKDSGDVVIKFDDRNAEISFSEGLLKCRLIEGRYPNYNSVIPKDNPNLLTIDRKNLLSALRRVVPFANESSQLVRLRIDNGKLDLTSEDLEFATSAEEKLSCDYTGTPMSIGFKGISLMEILSSLDSDEIILQLADPSRAGVIVPVTQPENEKILMLIMPMLLND